MSIPAAISLYDLIPDARTLIALEPEDLAGPLLLVLRSLAAQEKARNYGRRTSLHLGNFVGTFSDQYTRYQGQSAAAVMDALQEAWAWLVREGLLVPDGLTHPAGNYFVTRRGEALKDEESFKSYRMASRLPQDILHPTLQKDPWLNFIRGKYDISIFEAFREVEIAVREAGSFGPGDFGVALMRKAFDSKKGGPLARMSDEEGEREGLAHLFAGAIGSYKNAHSHRRPGLDDPLDAIEMLMLASHLLRIVDARRP